MTTSSVSQRSAHRTGLLLLVAAASLWSLNGVLVKGLQSMGVGGYTVAAGRSFIAALFLMPFALRRWKPVEHNRWLIGAVFAFTSLTLTFVLATTLTTAANAIILQYTAPAWVFVFAPLILGESAHARQWGALAAAMVGVGVIFADQISSDGLGLCLALTSGLTFGLLSVLLRRVRGLPPVMLAFMMCAGSGLLLMPLAVVFDGFSLTMPQLGWLAFTGVVQFGVPYVFYAAGIARVSSQEAILVVMLEPVLNPTWVWLARGETPANGTFLGATFILAGVLYLAVCKSNPRS